jgi:hemerythrin
VTRDSCSPKKENTVPLVEWRPEFSVGFARLDGEHHHLISLMNKLHMALVNGQEIFVLGGILKELDWYTRSHFRAEEVLMKGYGYPGLATHIVQHERFKEQLVQYADHFQSGRVAIAVEVLDALQEWLVRHILGSDAAYAAFFQATGVADMKIDLPVPQPQADCPAGTA